MRDIGVVLLAMSSCLASSSGAAPSARGVFDMWAGFWRLQRSVVSPVGSENMHASGVAAFVVSVDDPSLIKYSEKVVLNQQGGVGTQRYLYKLDPLRQAISKHFNDGRLFYNMSLSGSTVQADTHLCVADTYRPAYTFINATSFRLVYSVTGPAKAYTITTDFAKMSPEEIATEGLSVTDDGELE